MRKAFVRKLIQLSEQDKEILLLTGDLGFSVFDEYKEKFPKQFLNVGVSEQCMVGMAAGLALEGKKVFVYSIIPFLIYRSFEQIRNDLCYQKLPVKLIGIGSGLAYGGQGGTHHAIEDLGIMTSLPEMMVFAPADPFEVEKIMDHALDFDQPCYIRLNRAEDPPIHTLETISHFEIGKPLKVRGSGTEGVTVLASGNVLSWAIEIFEALDSKGIRASVYSLHTLKPLDGEALRTILKPSGLVVTMEEHVQSNGLFSLVSTLMQSKGFLKNILCVSLQDCFIHDVGRQEFLRESACLKNSEIIDTILSYGPPS